MTEHDEQFDRDLSTLDELAARSRYAQMRPILSRLLQQQPDNEYLLYYSAVCDWVADKDDEALATVSRLVETYPDSYDGRLLLFRILDSMGRYGEAEPIIIDLLREYPEDAHLYGRYSLLMLENMQVEKAGKLAERSLQLDPDSQMGLTASVLREIVTDPSDAASVRLQELVRRYPDSISTAMMVVSVLAAQNRNKEALRISQEILRERPDDESNVETVIALKTASHWSMLPLRPFQKWGWGASVGLWFLMIVAIRAVDGTEFEAAFAPVIWIFLGFVVYSWVWPPILKRLMKGF